MRKPKRPPNLDALFDEFSDQEFLDAHTRIRGPTHEGMYLHWDELRHRPPPEGLSVEQWWYGLKRNRAAQYKQIPLTDVNGNPFVFALPEEAQSMLHDVTQRSGGTMGITDQVTSPETRNRYIVRNLMEEGITSSQIEGASTTRAVAKQMLRTKRKPRDTSEQMILNNYTAMQYVITEGRTPLTPETVLHLHEMITSGTLEDLTWAGRLRRPGEPVDIIDMRDDQVLHAPPPAEQLPERLRAMCDFANGKTPEGFVHPVVRSILLHFWLAYDHPFLDGNGRCARTLFYWSMLQHNYWLCQFISISQIIQKAPIQYGRAFLHTETDGNDATYFLLHQLRAIIKAIDTLHEYIDGRVAERRRLEAKLRLASLFNDRQLRLVAHALRHPDAQYDIRTHQASEGVVYQTARADLLDLADKGLFIKRKTGRTFYFYAAPDLESRLAQLK